MRVKYTGPHEGGVTVVDPGAEFEVAFGETVEVPDALAKRLVAQEPTAWSIEKAAKAAKDGE